MHPLPHTTETNLPFLTYDHAVERMTDSQESLNSLELIYLELKAIPVTGIGGL
jgi:hypothetical protein